MFDDDKKTLSRIDFLPQIYELHTMNTAATQ